MTAQQLRDAIKALGQRHRQVLDDIEIAERAADNCLTFGQPSCVLHWHDMATRLIGGAEAIWAEAQALRAELRVLHAATAAKAAQVDVVPPTDQHIEKITSDWPEEINAIQQADQRREKAAEAELA